MTNHREIVSAIMDMMNAEYPTKFSTTPERLKVWAQMLKGFDSEIILGAAYHLVSTNEWPPNIAQVREQCVLMSHGEPYEPTGQEAWENIWRKVAGEEIELTDLEKRALKQTSSIYDLKRSSNPSTDRAHFIKAFDQLVAARKLERQTLPEVKALVEKNRPALPAPVEKQLPKPIEKEPNYPTGDEVSTYVNQVLERIEG